MVTQSPKEQLREIYTHFGVCSQYGQNLETLVVGVLKLAARTARPNITTGELAELDSELSARTLGRLRQQLRQRVTVAADLDAKLGKALATRNHLVHHWFGVNAGNLMSAAGRSTCLVNLGATEDILAQALESLWPVVHEYFGKVGWSPEQVQQALSALMKAEVPDGPDFDA